MAVQDTEARKQLTTAVNTFGWRAFSRTASAAADDNTFLSPFSLAQLLSISAGGANGKTLEEMLSVLFVKDASLLSGYYNAMNEMLSKTDSAEVSVANSTWARADKKLTEEFVKLSDIYHAQALPLPKSAEPINKWCSDHTNGKITSIINQVDPNLVLVLINALYFKGLFTNPFDVKDTREMDFNLATGGTTKVQMMHMSKEKILYRETPVFQAVQLGYGKKNSNMSCVVVLPKKGTSMEAVLQGGDNQWQEFATANFKQREGNLALPRFKAETTLDFTKTLQAMGMPTAFSLNADFSKMLQPSDGVLISQVLQKTYVEVNEKGTEAAAVSCQTTWSLCAKITEEPFYMTVNRPFLFIIQEKTSGVVLFVGKVGSPK